MSSSQTQLFKVLADDSRRTILDALLTHQQTVSELTDLLGISQPAVSQHLTILKSARLVSHRKHGRHQHYSVNPEQLLAVDEWLDKYRIFWLHKLDALDNHLHKQKN